MFAVGYTAVFNNTTLYANAGNVGIGTATPTQKLDVNGNARIQGLTTAGLVQTDASGNLSSATAASLDPTTASNGLTKTGNDFRLGGTLAAATTIAQGSNAFSLTGTGNVGIGTTTPIQKLDVATGSLRVGTFEPFTAVRATNQGAHLQWNRTVTDGETWLINHMGAGTANAGIRFGGVTTSTGTTPTEWARFLNNGNFGIGTTAPSALLDVNGSTRLRGLTTAGLVTTDGSGNLSSATAASLDPTTASNGLTKTGNDFRLGGTLAAATTIAQAGNDFRMTGGKVGLGTASPAYALHLGDATTGGSAHALLQGVFGNASYLRHSRLMFNDANFGIGAGAQSATAGDDDLYFYAYNGADRDIRFMHTDNASTNPSGTGWTTDLIIKQGGNVGVGTISPATRLDVNGNLRLAVRLCPVNTAGIYPLVAADVAFSIFKTQIGNAVSTITLPGSIGQVEGQELTIINASDINVTVNGSTDNGGGVTLPNANGPGIHAVKYVWATYSGGTGVWFRVQ